MAAYDYVIKGGRVIDPANGVDKNADVAIQGGRIAAIADDIDPGQARQIYDARGQVVVPGLVDLHVHVYDKVTPLGVDVDEQCLRRGVTTVVDAGSAGYFTFPGFRHYVVERARCRVLAFLNISSIGLAGAGPRWRRPAAGGAGVAKVCLRRRRRPGDRREPRRHRRRQDPPFRHRRQRGPLRKRSVPAGAEARPEGRASLDGPPRLFHGALTECPWPLGKRRHLHPLFPRLSLPRSSIPPQPPDRPRGLGGDRRGVVFDIGHGQGSFNWTVAEIATAEGLWPQVISTDLHSGNVDGPAYDLPTVMTRLLHLGMPLVDVIAGRDHRPARAIGWATASAPWTPAGRGYHRPLHRPVDLDLEDCQSQLRRIQRADRRPGRVAGRRLLPVHPSPILGPTP